MSENKSTRLCHIIKREDFDGYGFNLHAEKGKAGQYIGKVDDNSPAEQAGLKQGDRIIEVNGVNIGNETHKQVVQRIKAIADEVRLLVVDPAVPVSNNNQVIDGSTTNSVTSTATLSADDHINANDAHDAPVATTNGKNGQSSPIMNNKNDANAHSPTMNTSPVTTTTPATKGTNSEGLNLKMTAAELRAKLAAKKKYDPKNDTVDLRKKYEIVQKL